ncbi:MAG: hypothetical protein QNJ01_11225 [Desulfobacterales bacterium]|nr:hypothetical protein [Desulfobacterales bacterium]
MALLLLVAGLAFSAALHATLHDTVAAAIPRWFGQRQSWPGRRVGLKGWSARKKNRATATLRRGLQPTHLVTLMRHPALPAGGLAGSVCMQKNQK